MPKKDDNESLNALSWGRKTSNQPTSSQLTEEPAPEMGATINQPKAVGINLEADDIIMKGIGRLELMQMGYSESEADDLIANRVKSKKDFKRVFNKSYLLHISPSLHRDLKFIATNEFTTMRAMVVKFMIEGLEKYGQSSQTYDFEKEMLTRTK
jgi:hypothetical protein